MVRVQLYRADRVILDQTTSLDRARALIDATLNDLHHGQHGEGKFVVTADHVTADGLFMGVFWASPEIHHPARVIV
jgi:predicted ATPase